MSDIIFNEKNEVIDLKNKNKADFKSLAQNNKLSEKFILENGDFLDWNIISENQALTVEIMVKCTQKIKWKKVLTNPHISADAAFVGIYKGDLERLVSKEKTISDAFVRTYQHLFDFSEFDYEKISNDLLEELADKINWTYAFCHDRKDEAFIRRNMYHFDKYNVDDQKEIWEYISMVQSVSEAFLREFADRVCYEYVASTKGRQVLSDAYVEDFKYVLDSEYIITSQKQNLSPAYLKEYKKFDLDKFYETTTEEWIRNYPYPNRLDWGKISEYMQLSEDFILENFDKLMLFSVVQKNKFSEEFARIIIKISPKNDLKDNLGHIFRQAHSLAFLEEYIDEIDFNDIAYSPIVKNFPLDFIRKHQKKINWEGLGQIRKFEEDFLREFQKKWDWNYVISVNQRVSEDFLREFEKKFDEWGWCNIIEYQKLTEKFIREIIAKYPRKIDWDGLCQFQQLSEVFLREFAKKVNWEYIKLYQTVSPEFKEEFKSKFRPLDDDQIMLHFHQKATNILVQEVNNHEKLQEALAFIEQAIFYQKKLKMKDTTYADATKVNILLALGNKETAYHILKTVFEGELSTYYLNTFKYDLDFLDWCKYNK